jgi:superoxide dismutase, Fe-Mn family
MHSPASAVSRRFMLKTLGAGAALFGLARGAVFAQGAPAPAANAAAAASSAAVDAQPFTLPKLPYAYDALVPHIDARTMEIHHTKHHQAYITAANKALESRPDLRELGGEQLIGRLDAFEEPLRTTLRNQLGGHLNHSFFWTLLAPPVEYRAGPLRAAIAKQFGGLEAFQKEFAQAAATRFGSGWAWLVWQDGALKVISTANQDSPLMLGARPIIGLDVWEHAYYLEYQNRRADYVKAFWNVLNWDAAEAAYAEIVSV